MSRYAVSGAADLPEDGASELTVSVGWVAGMFELAVRRSLGAKLAQSAIRHRAARIEAQRFSTHSVDPDVSWRPSLRRCGLALDAVEWLARRIESGRRAPTDEFRARLALRCESIAYTQSRRVIDEE